MSSARLAAAALALAVLALVLVACGGNGGNDQPEGPTATTGPRPTSPNLDLGVCSATPAVLGNVASPELVEVSGIASSRSNDGVLWAHNDSGDSARVFALAGDGSLLATYTLVGADTVDWEDMAIGPGPGEGTDYLYLADIGDNNAIRPEIVLYRVAEPEVAVAVAPATLELDDVDRLRFEYPDHPHDAEALLIDPDRGEIFIMTKELQTPASNIYRASTAVEPGGTVMLDMVGQLDLSHLASRVQLPPDAPQLPRALPHLVTGGDVSPEGDLIALRTYSTVWVWSRQPDTSLTDALRNAPCEGPSAVEAQGEAIAFDADGRGYTTIGEGANPPINHFAAP